MSKIAILADSGCQLSTNRERGIYIVPLQITVNEKTYLDQIDLSSKEIFEMMANDPNCMPKTSQPSVGDILETVECIKQSGYTQVIAISIATGLSSTLSGIKIACEMAGMDVTLIDSKGTAGNHRYLVEVCASLIQDGKSAQEIEEVLTDLIKHSGTLIMANNLNHLKRGGRITPAVAMLAGMLKIVPVMKLNHELGGKIDILGKVRTIKHASDLIVEDMLKSMVNGKDYIFTVEHVLADDLVVDLVERLKTKIPDIDTLTIDLLPTVVGCHMGVGGIGYQYIKKYKDVK